jgi:hypothetical protein
MVYYMVENDRRRVNLYDTNIPKPALDVMGGRGQSTHTGETADEINYLVYYAGRVQPMDTLLGDRQADQDRGIFHYQIGKDSGIVKSINLSKTDSPGLAEVRFEQEGYDGLQQLLVLYDANIKSYLDVTAFPGSYIYIEPRGFDTGMTDPKRFTNLGIGGYYMITETDHSLGWVRLKQASLPSGSPRLTMRIHQMLAVMKLILVQRSKRIEKKKPLVLME